MSAIEGLAYLHAQGMKQPQSTKIENLPSILSLETIHTGGNLCRIRYHYQVGLLKL